MQKTIPLSLAEIEERSLNGEDLSSEFGEPILRNAHSEIVRNRSTVAGGKIQKVNIDFGEVMLTELDGMASELNISRQAVIKMFVKNGLDNHFIARQARTKIKIRS